MHTQPCSYDVTANMVILTDINNDLTFNPIRIFEYSCLAYLLCLFDWRPFVDNTFTYDV